jgi:transposase
MNTRKQYSSAFKAQLVQEMLREEKAVSQLAAEHGIHPNQLHKWRSIAVEGLPSLFRRTWSKARSRRRMRRMSRSSTARLGG